MSRQIVLRFSAPPLQRVARWGNRGVSPRIFSVSRSLAFYGIPPPDHF